MDPITPTPTSSQGPVIGIIVIIVVLIVGAFFFFTRVSSPETQPLQNATTSDATIGASDDPNAIASDLEAESFNDIDADLNALDAELDQ